MSYFDGYAVKSKDDYIHFTSKELSKLYWDARQLMEVLPLDNNNIHFIAKCNQHTINLAVPFAFVMKQGYSRKKSLCIVGGPVFEFCVIFLE
jgi:hypothetical protein